MKKLYLYTILVFTLLLGNFLSLNTAEAQSLPPFELEGYAWSSNIGWISLNCIDGGANATDICATSDYKVEVNSSGNFSGYAWSSNIGWIRFTGFDTQPPGGSLRQNPEVNVNGSGYIWEGWVRACAGVTSDINGCDTNGTNSSNPLAGGWDGWISFGGPSLTHQVRMNPVTGGGFEMVPNSYAWGSDVVGWVDMWSHVKIKVKGRNNIQADDCLIAEGASTCNSRVTWTFDSSITSRSVRQGSAQFSTGVSGTNVSRSIGHGKTNFTIWDTTTTPELDLDSADATCVSGTSWNGSICERDTSSGPVPAIDFSANPPIVRSGRTTTLSWEITNITDINECKLSGFGITGTEANITDPADDFVTDPITSISRFKITCTGAYGTVEESVVVEVIPISQEV